MAIISYGISLVAQMPTVPTQTYTDMTQEIETITRDGHITPAEFKSSIRMLAHVAGFPTDRTTANLVSLLSLLLSILTFVLQVGFSSMALEATKRQDIKTTDVFMGFKELGRWIALWFWTGLFTFLWGLLFVIPGLVASYRYRQAMYLMLEDPQLKARQAIRASKSMMHGHKAELFVLDLSFILWLIASALPFIGMFVGLYAQPYLALTRVQYYLGLNNRPQEGEPLPTEGVSVEVPPTPQAPLPPSSES